MSIFKKTIAITEDQEAKNTKISHLSRNLDKLYEILLQDAPKYAENINKHDLLPRNLEEILVLLTFRSKQNERLDNYAKKIKKIVWKI